MAGEDVDEHHDRDPELDRPREDLEERPEVDQKWIGIGIGREARVRKGLARVPPPSAATIEAPEPTGVPPSPTGGPPPTRRAANTATEARRLLPSRPAGRSSLWGSQPATSDIRGGLAGGQRTCGLASVQARCWGNNDGTIE